MRLQSLYPDRNFAHRNFELIGQGARHPGLVQQIAPRRFPGQGFDPPHTRRYAALGDDLEQSNVPRARDMSAAAQFDRIGAVTPQRLTKGQHPHAIAVLLTEKRQRSGLYRRLRHHFLGLGLQVLPHNGIDLTFDGVDLRSRQRPTMAEVKA